MFTRTASQQSHSEGSLGQRRRGINGSWGTGTWQPGMTCGTLSSLLDPALCLHDNRQPTSHSPTTVTHNHANHEQRSAATSLVNPTVACNSIKVGYLPFFYDCKESVTSSFCYFPVLLGLRTCPFKGFFPVFPPLVLHLLYPRHSLATLQHP